ncbi:ExbD/TolR family protein [Roseibium sp.]|uniref:ExbD/TolR family protein n=1 Tax=Roseibium sp. TaxID=1936156 RepID=UPI0039EF5928
MKRYTKPIHVPQVMAHRAADSSLALINVVFLLLLFLLVSGTLRPPLPDDFDWAETTADQGSSNIQDSLVLTETGDFWFKGAILDEAQLLGFLAEASARSNRLTLQVDKRARVETIAGLAKKAQAAGIARLSLVTVEAGNR